MKKFMILFLLLLVITLGSCESFVIQTSEDLTTQSVTSDKDITTDSITTDELTSDDITTDDVNIDIPEGFNGRILVKDTGLLELHVDGVGVLKYSAKTKVYQIVGNNIERKTISDIYIGMDNVYFYLNESNPEKADFIIIDGPTVYENIRVRINSNLSVAGDSDKYHDIIELKADSVMSISNLDHSQNIQVDKGDTVKLDNVSGYIKISVNNNQVMLSQDRVIITQDRGYIYVNSISRAYGIPHYYGKMEVSTIGNKLMLINDIKLEQYLMGVVPSEMPTSFGSNALEAQSVAARTYALADLEREANASKGYHVDDSVSSQVYNNSKPSLDVTLAVRNTEGIVMKSGDSLVDAKYFSTSSGCTSSSNNVWFTDTGVNNILGVPYLKSVCSAEKLNGEKILFDISDESSMLEYFELIKMYTPDANSSFHRWKVSMTFSELTETLQTYLPVRFAANPTQVLTLSGDNFISSPIPSNIGKVTNIYVSERGESGVVKSLVIETEKHTFKIYREYNIRFAFRYIDLELAKNTDVTYTSSRNDFSLLPSGYFAVKKNSTSLVFYGGGFGHGVGMSQYGAKGLGLEGYDFEQILKYYYTDINLIDIFDVSGKTPLGDSNELFIAMYKELYK